MSRLGTRVRANDYRSLRVPELGAWTPERSVTVVLPTYQSQAELDLTLAALETQTYPAHLVEVLVVDDGSEPPIVAPPFEGNMRVVRQDRNGFGAARARNRGAAEGTGEIILFLDSDMLPERTWIEAHARWHHVADDVVTLGRRSHVDPEGLTPDLIRSAESLAGLFADRDTPSPAWLEAHFRRTNDLLDDPGDLFRVVTSGNVGVTRAFFHEIGGFDETFNQWGGEDTEFGFRAYTAGALLVPDPGAYCWHQGPGLEPDSAEAASMKFQRAKMAHLVAHPSFRSDAPGRSYAVPLVTVLVDGGDLGGDVVARQVEAVLASDHHDLVVGVSMNDGTAADWVNRQFEGDPRYAGDRDLEALHPFAQLRLEIPPGLEVGDKVVRRLANAARTAGVVTVQTAQGQVRVGQTRALRRVGVEAPSRWEDAALVFGHKEMRAFDLQLSEASAPWTDRLPTPAQKVIGRFRGIRSWNDLMVTLRWFAAGASSVLGLKSRRKLGVAGREGARHGTPPLPGLYSTGGEGFERLPHLLGPRTDLAYGVEPPSASILAKIEESGGSFLRLDPGPNPLAVPPFDPRRFNPAGWLPTHGSSDRSFNRVPDPSLELRQHRAVVIPAPRTAEEAARVAVLAAMGVVLRPADDGDWDGWLGPALGGAITAVVDLDDRVLREGLSVRQRRAAHQHHSTYARRAQLKKAAGIVDIGVETASVLLVTNRADHIPAALGRIARQDHRPLEVALGLHGIDAPDGLDEILGDIPLRVVAVPAATLYGDLLNMTTAACSGEWIVKMDDDDHHAPSHVTDLVLTGRYSGADLVGKGAEFIHLEDKDVTIRRLAGDPESGSRTISGGALAVRRSALRRVGGWARVKRGVDQTLISAVLDTGGTIYRTHGFGFVVGRRAEGHTWSAGHDYFEKQALHTWAGLERMASGLDEPPLS